MLDIPIHCVQNFPASDWPLGLWKRHADWLNFIHFSGWQYKIVLIYRLRKRGDQAIALISISTILQCSAWPQICRRTRGPWHPRERLCWSSIHNLEIPKMNFVFTQVKFNYTNPPFLQDIHLSIYIKNCNLFVCLFVRS